MPSLNVNGSHLFYRLEGNEDRPVLILSNSLGTDHGLWDLVMPALLPHFRILRYDSRGHGASDAPEGDYSIADLGRDVLVLAAALQIPQFAFCGLSLGGMIGQWLAANSPDRIRSLVLANSSPLVTPASGWDERRRIVLDRGMAGILDLAMRRFFSSEFIARNHPIVGSVRTTFLAIDPVGYAGCCAAIRDMDQTDVLHRIRVPTLVIVGDNDVATPAPGHGEILSRKIRDAKLVRLPAAHLSSIERPLSFAAALLDFLQPHESGQDLYAAGLAMRRQILGEQHVDRSLAGLNDFNRDFQEFITRYAWGTIWTRPGLDSRTRSLLVLAITSSLGRWEEFRLHLRAGLARGLEQCDLKEVLLQTAVYAGVPAANTGFAIAAEELKIK